MPEFMTTIVFELKIRETFLSFIGNCSQPCWNLRLFFHQAEITKHLKNGEICSRDHKEKRSYSPKCVMCEAGVQGE